jgi:hypothetical protein
VVGDQLGDASGVEDVDDDRPVGLGEIEVHPAHASQPSGQGQGEDAAHGRLGDEQVVEGRPPAGQHLLGGEHG